MIHLGSNVAKLRGYRRLLQKEVANKLGMSQQEYSKIEAKPEIDDELLARIAAIVEFPVDLIKELDMNTSIQNFNQSGGNAGNFSNSSFHYNPIDKIIELYDSIIRDKDELLKSKDQIIQMYKDQQKAS